jgi:hypothetical protein
MHGLRIVISPDVLKTNSAQRGGLGRMTTFDWLIVGHLIGDWLLQNDWMAKGKRVSHFNVPGLIHYTIYTTTIIVVLYLSGARDKPLIFYFVWIVIVFGVHWVLDASRLVDSWMRVARQTQREMMRLMVDQTMHILVLAVLAASI